MKRMVFGLVVMACGLAFGETVVERLADDIVRIRMTRNGVLPESLLNRYGLIEKLDAKQVKAAPDGFVLPKMTQTERGFKLEFALADNERIYGLGDVSRENLNRRGEAYVIWITDLTSYIPIPMIVSSRGYGVLMNCTRRHTWDIGKADRGTMTISADEGEVDFYLFKGAGYPELLEAYTRLTGRPKLLPAFAYGFAYVANEHIDCHEVVHEAREFRDRKFPCDVFGLEPGWIEGFYDSTTKKMWNKRFKVPNWIRRENQMYRTWLDAIKRMGFKLSLWLCMRYDLFVYEEALAEGTAVPIGPRVPKIPQGDGTFKDDHISTGFTGAETNAVSEMKVLESEVKQARREMVGRLDGKTGEDQSGEEPWFEHLRKFVDDGARCFKLDAGWQVLEFPGRKWAGKYFDDVAHNVYPMVYAKQMATGYENYTGERAMVYSAGGYVGVQRYVATWAGDTGGGVKTLVSTINLGVSGHPLQSCDIEISDLPSLHYGIFAPWSQLNNWDYFDQPWNRDDADYEAVREYVKLRYRLFPYIYTIAAKAARTGWPMVRPLAFVYPNVAEYANECGTYLFGDSLLVSAFSNETIIPEGVWYDWRSGEKVTGPCRKSVKVGDGWGGGLYVKAGSVIPMWPQKQHVEQGWNNVIELHIWPGPDGEFELYEDDGNSLSYLKGDGAITKFTLKNNEVDIGIPEGAFASKLPASRQFKVIKH